MDKAPVSLFSVESIKELGKGYFTKETEPDGTSQASCEARGHQGSWAVDDVKHSGNFRRKTVGFFLLNYHVLQEVGYTMVHF